MAEPGDYFAEGSADEAISFSLKCAAARHTLSHQHAPTHTRTHTRTHTYAHTLTRTHVHRHTRARVCRTGDVVLINQRCSKLPLPAAALCWLSKFGISGDGRGCWDHAAFVLRDTKTDVPYLLEGGLSGATLRTYEERLLQNGGYREEMTLLPLGGLESSPADLARVDALLGDLRMSRTLDGMDGPRGDWRCVNLWSLYQHMRSPPRSLAAERAQSTAAAAAAEPATDAGCAFGAPLVGRALQRLGALDSNVDVAGLTPAAFMQAKLATPAKFGTPVSLR